ncbi:hypothetical protein [Thalassobacillus sp. C254]|uniref:hypothetical protein n=1 Tax=Thalassobacillus sp. C254 TaxID=1225341 RepID=UPI0006D2C193|nr:hypothetical protein [Thalassobacillus sp. C254]
MKKYIIGPTLFLAILLTACEDGEELTEAEEKNEQTIPVSDEDSIHLSSQYELYSDILSNFELPEEGRLSHKEALDHFPGGIEIKETDVAYENWFIFDENKQSKRIYWHQYDDIGSGERSEPYGTQSLGLFMAVVDKLAYSYSNPQGEMVTSLEELTKEDHDILQIEDKEELLIMEAGEPARGKGWLAMKAYATSGDKYLSELEPYIEKLEGYEPLLSWIEETRAHFHRSWKMDKKSTKKRMII